MGVPRLFQWFIKNFGNYVQYLEGSKYIRNFDYIYLDANCFLHEATQLVFNYGQNKRKLDKYASLSVKNKIKKVYEKFFDSIVNITKIIKPTTVLYIAIDGPAPLAKQAQQRQRRFVSSQTRNESSFDSNAITPGTLFMHRLSQYMHYAIRKYMDLKPDWRGIKVYFSPPTVAGEGEHKIMDFIRKLDIEERSKKSHCFVGPDGDLLMLTLAAKVYDIFLFREDQFSRGNYHLLNMGLIRRILNIKLDEEFELHKRSMYDIINDFIFLGFFVGNDFLPKIQMFHLLEDGLEFVLDLYVKLARQHNFLSENGKINLVTLLEIVENLSPREEDFLVDQVETTLPYKQPPSEKFINKTIIRHISETKHGKIFDFEGYRYDYYQKAGISSKNSEEIDKICFSYFKTLLWVFEYYTKGLISWEWSYKYHYAPLMCDFQKFLHSHNSVIKFIKGSPSLPFEQLLSVLPTASSKLLPFPYYKLMTDSESPLVKLGYYPIEFEIDYEGKLKEYQGVTLLPFVDFRYIRVYYEEMKKCCTKKRYIRNRKGDVYIFEYDPNYIVNFNSYFGSIKNSKVRRTNEFENIIYLYQTK